MKCLFLLLFLGLGATPAWSVDPNAFLQTWFAAQTNFHTWSAEFTQTRHLKALTQPLTTKGRLWFSAPNRFRWEIGDPPQTIALRQTDRFLILYPKLKRAEIYPLSGKQAEGWRDALALLDAGFPRNRADFERQFRLLSITEAKGGVDLVMEPKSSAARKMMSRIELSFVTNNFSLAATQVYFGDGSWLRNDFTNAVLNGPVDEALFNPTLGTNYSIVEPFRK